MARRFDVAIIGGGITGCATALELARGGASVVVLERGEIAALASAANSGSLHAQIPFEPFAAKGEAWARSFAPVARFLGGAVDVWKTVEVTLGVELEVSVKGGLLVAATADQMRLAERKFEIERAAGLDVELWSTADLAAHAPYLAPGHVGGVFCRNEGKANPLVAGRAFAAAAARAGAVIRRDTEVAGLAREGRGWRIGLAAGETVDAGAVVNAAGAEAPRLAAMAGAPFAAEGFPIQASVTERVAPCLPHLLYAAREKLTLKQTAAGALIIGGGWPARPGSGGRPVVDPASLVANLEVAGATMPAIAGLRVLRTWAAVVNGTEDWLPVIGEAAGAPGFFNAFFPWMGFTAAPLVARRVAEAVLGGGAGHDSVLGRRAAALPASG